MGQLLVLFGDAAEQFGDFIELVLLDLAAIFLNLFDVNCVHVVLAKDRFQKVVYFVLVYCAGIVLVEFAEDMVELRHEICELFLISRRHFFDGLLEHHLKLLFIKSAIFITVICLPHIAYILLNIQFFRLR